MSATLSTRPDSSQLLRGAPWLLSDICMIYPATVDDIGKMGTQEFDRLLQHITLHPPAISKELKDVSGYQFIIEQSKDAEFLKRTERAIAFFLREDCLIMPDAGIFALGGDSDSDRFRVITEKEFDAIQDIIRLQHRLKPIHSTVESGDSAKVRELKEKFERNRQLVSKIKANQGDGDTSLDFGDMIATLIVAIPGITPDNVWDLTYYAFQDLFIRFQRKAAHDMNMRASLAGAKIPKKEMKGWIRPIETE